MNEATVSRSRRARQGVPERIADPAEKQVGISFMRSPIVTGLF